MTTTCTLHKQVKDKTTDLLTNSLQLIILYFYNKAERKRATTAYS